MRPIFSIIGLFLAGLSVAMLAPIAVDRAHAIPFAWAAALTGFVAGVLYLSCRGVHYDIGRRKTYLLTSGAWVAVSLFGALPFMFMGFSVSDAVFETVSGLTTTGSTVLTGLDQMSKALLLWRAILQWTGGVGIIVMSIAVLPLLRVGGMQLFKTESSERSDKELPRAAMVAGATLWVYVGLSVICALAYWVAGMNGFDAVTHAMSTLATGGYSTHDASMGYFGNHAIHWIAMIFMVAGGLPIVLYIRFLRGGTVANLQVKALLLFLVGVISVLTLWLTLKSDIALLDALRLVAFNVISVVTTTGFATTDYTTWGGFPTMVFFALTFCGACTGSTAGGMKFMRFIVAFKMIRSSVSSLFLPHGVFVDKYEGKRLSGDISESVGVFMFVFMASFALLAVMLHATGLDFETSLSGSITAISNVGPGLGSTIGPAGNFSSLPVAAKWMLSFGMLLGRLEFFTLLVLFTPAYWRA